MAKVVGVENVDYVSKKTGKSVKGIKLHMLDKSDNVIGYVASQEFLSEKVDCSVKVNDEVQLFYNKFGQVTSVVVS